MNDSRYLVTMAIEDGDGKHAWSVFFPDLPGCFSAGDSLPEAITNARDAVILFIEDAIEHGSPLPQPRPLDEWKRDPEFAGPKWSWHIADVDLDEIVGPPERVNVIVPRVALVRIDAAARRLGQSRSAFLVEAGLERATREQGAEH